MNTTAGGPGTTRRPTATTSALSIPAISSAAAAILHASAAGVHAEATTLSRLFVALALLQGGAAVWAFLRPGRSAALALIGINAAAAIGWVVTRLTGISWISGLEVAERPQLADSIAAAFAVVAVAGAAASLSKRSSSPIPTRAVANAALVAGVLLVPGLANATNHEHSHDASTTTADGHDHPAEAAAAGNSGAAGTGEAAAADDGHDHEHTGDAPAAPTTDPATGEHATTDEGHSHATSEQAADVDAITWPRPWDPTDPIDFSGVPGVTAEQQARAERLVSDTLRDLPAFADVNSIEALGYQSIGDASTGFEHYINYGLFGDEKLLDPTAPESLVYQVDGDQRTLVSAMFIASDTPIDDPELVDFGGSLMQWHVHDNLCWGLDENGQPKVMGVLANPDDTCPPQTINAGGENPMVHVWIAPHECGPFAALEGHGAGQVDPTTGDRTDQCGHSHGTATASPTTTPYDPALPIDLGGLDGVTPQQQAFAENLVAATVRDLPQWADVEVAEAAGFRSIGDGFLGHEHYINWDWIDDDVWLDPDAPESLVFEPQPDGSKRLVSAMFMLPPAYPLEDVPDWGGQLMQWHVHGDLCFTDDAESPQVVGLKPIGGTCQAPLVDFLTSPMIHVWITPTPCGPFAALEGVAGGQVPEGEEVRCDHAHGG